MKQPSPKRDRFPDLARAPFADRAGAPPAAVAEDIVACLRTVAGLARRTSKVFRAVVADLGIDPREPLAAAGARIAADIDAGGLALAVNPYHNSQHTCEVVLCSLLLARQAGLSPPHRARVAVAALAHDFRHDGTTNADERFRLEQLAVDSAHPYLRRAGVAPAERERIAGLVLATEPSIGVPYARRCFRFFYQDGPGPGALPHPGPATRPLGLLAEDRDLAFQAVLLGEADLLPSVALTYDYAMLCQARLSQEDRRIAPTPAEKLAFLDRHLPGFLVGRFFEPNLERVRGAIAAALGPGEESSGRPPRTLRADGDT